MLVWVGLWRKWRSTCVSRRRGGGLSLISDSGDLYMSPECVVQPDVSDSDGHCGPGIQRFPLLPIPRARPLYPCDKMRRRHVSWSATLSLTHSLIYSFFASYPKLSVPVVCIPFFLFSLDFLSLFLLPISFPFSSFCLLVCSLKPPLHFFLLLPMLFLAFL